MSADESAEPASIAGLIASVEGGDRAAASMLFTTLYRELHRVAAHQLRLRAHGVTLSATTLLHECYLNMAKRDAAFPDRARFMAYAARAMRGLIVDYIREQRALKRGGEFHLTVLDTGVADALPRSDEATHLADALGQLEATDPELAELVDFKFFCGFSLVEIAAMRGVSERTVQRDWRKARLLLHRALTME